MTTSRPYLLRALFEWILDNHQTPYIVVDAEDKEAVVPENLAQNGTIVFNISPDAIGRLNIKNDAVTFDASFSGVIRHITAPIHAVMAIYAQENGAGMMFHEAGVPGEEDFEEQGETKDQKIEQLKTQRPKLRIVKDNEQPEDNSDDV